VETQHDVPGALDEGSWRTTSTLLWFIYGDGNVPSAGEGKESFKFTTSSAGEGNRPSVVPIGQCQGLEVDWAPIAHYPNIN